MTRSLPAVPALLLAAALLTACGDESTSDGSERQPAAAEATDSEGAATLTPRTASFRVLDTAAAQVALLSQTNVGPLFEQDGAIEDPTVPDETAEPVETGCDSDAAFEDQFDPDNFALAGANIDYFLIDDARLMVVSSDVRSFGDDATAEAAFNLFTDAIGECTHFEDTSEDGSESTVIDVTLDTDSSVDAVDDAFSLVGDGSWTLDGQVIPLGVGFSAARVDSNVTMVMLLSIGVPEDSELLPAYADIAAARLAAVADGETPEEVEAPQPATVTTRIPLDLPSDFEGFYDSAPGFFGED